MVGRDFRDNPRGSILIALVDEPVPSGGRGGREADTGPKVVR